LRILVTGGAGFVGSHVSDAYLALGHDVAILDDLSRGSRNNLNPAARFYEGSLLDPSFLHSVLSRERPEVVNHHAAQTDVIRSTKDPLFDASVNILGSLNLLQASASNLVHRFIYASSGGAIYGNPNKLPVDEQWPPHPVTPYGISKHTVEHYLYSFANLYGISHVSLRYGNVYGPRQSTKGEAGVFAIFCQQMLAGEQSVIYGDGSKQRDYVFVSDVVSANVAALDHDARGIFNIATGIGTCDFDVFALLRELLDRPNLKPRYEPKRPGEVDRIWLDVRLSIKELSWEPKVSLKEGAQLTAAYFRGLHETSANAALGEILL
jgi:UDP-glucose 4-epimerase